MNAMSGFDTGGGGSDGPWISWSARGTQDGAIPANKFYLRDEAGKQVFAAFESPGVVLDIVNMKTGWQKSDGVIGQAPDWKWNASVSQMASQPGEEYKKGFQIKCAIGDGNTATWEQAGAGAWNAFTALVPALQQGPDGKLPLVRVNGSKQVQFKRGSTSEPILEVVQWVDRPDCLKEGVAAGVDTGNQPAPQQAAPPAQNPDPTPQAQASVPAAASF